MQPAEVEGGLNFSAVTAGWHHSCAQQSDGTVYCWGRGNDGQLGSGAAASSPVPVKVDGDVKFTMLTAGESHTCGLAADGRAFCWGKGSDGRLGVGRDGPVCARRICPSPVQVRAPESLRWISAGNSHTCAVGASGKAYCWGDGVMGKLGLGDRRSTFEPAEVQTDVRFKMITAADQHTCGLSADGVAYCWGSNSFGQVGNGERSFFKDQRIPGPVVREHQFASVLARGDFSCGVTAAGEALCWGYNNNGQLGPMVKDLERQAEPTLTSRVSFTALAAGPNHMCGISSAGGLHCWGDSGHGRLGYTRRTADEDALPLVPRPLPERAQLAAATAAARGNTLAPSGLPHFDEGIRRALVAQQADSIAASVGFRVPGAPQDEVVWALYQGTALHYAGRFRESNQALQRAVQLMETQGGPSLSDRLITAAGARERGSTVAELAALIVNNRPFPRQLSIVERGMVRYYSTLNLVHGGDLAGAAGEAQQLLSVLGARDPAAANGSTARIRAMLSYFAGAVLEAAGDRSNSEVAYQAARQMDPSGELPMTPPPARGTGEVVLVVERGFVAHRVATTIEVPLSEGELAALSSGETGRRLEAAFPIARQVTSFLSSQPSGGVFQPGNGRALRLGRGSGRNETTLQLPVPVLRLDSGGAPLAGTIVASGGPATPVGPPGDLTAAVAADLVASRELLLPVSLSRSAMNLAANRRTQASAAEPVTLGSVAGGIASILATGNDQADTRAWHLIPGEMALVRMRLPAGTQRLVLKPHGDGSASEVDLGSIEIREGETTIASRRIWR